MAQSRFNFFYMLAGLSAPLLLAPLLEDFSPLDSGSILAGAFLLLFGLSIRSFRADTRWRRANIGLASMGMFAALTLFVADSPLVQTVVTSLMLAFITFGVSRAVVEVVFSGGTINANYLAGAVCVYLQFAVIMGVIYHFIELAMPGSFSGVRGGPLQVLDFLYYSLVTLTTVGYGEIVPKLSTARALATFQAVVGQFYIAVIVATLVSRWLAQGQDRVPGRD